MERGHNRLSRWRIALLSLLFGVIAVAAIVGPVSFVAWRLAVSAQQAEFDQTAARVLARADAIYAEAATVLHTVAETGLAPCSPDNIQLLQEQSLQSLIVDNIAYARDGYVRCNEFGMVRMRIAATEVDAVQPDGIALNVNWQGTVPNRGLLLVMKLDGYRVLVDQRKFYDELLRPGKPPDFAVRTLNGIALSAYADDEAIQPAPDETVAAEARSDNWIVSIFSPPLSIGQYLESMHATFVPLSVAIGILCGAGSLWLLSRPTSPSSALAKAIRNRQLVIHYQPIIELATRRCIGAEALVRLRSADGSLIRPDLFIAYAEDTGLIGSVTDQVVRSVVEELGDLLRRDHAMHIAINLSGSDIVSGSILEVLDEALAHSYIAAQQVWLEATERSFINTEGARSTLAELQRRGHRTVIDDFGTGYSSLGYLKDLPIDTLKIDKAFVETVGTAAPTSNVTGHIIAMARELNLSLVAEGVETEAQASFLLERQVQLAQGWLFARALPVDAFLDFYRLNRAEHGTPTTEPATADAPA